MQKFTRSTKDGELTTLLLDEAVDQFIRDNHAYVVADGTLDEDDDVEDWLEDMPTVFETQAMLSSLEAGEKLTSGIATFTRN